MFVDLFLSVVFVVCFCGWFVCLRVGCRPLCEVIFIFVAAVVVVVAAAAVVVAMIHYFCLSLSSLVVQLVILSTAYY